MKKREIQIVLIGGTLAERALIASELCSLMDYGKWGSGEVESIVDGHKVDLDFGELYPDPDVGFDDKMREVFGAENSPNVVVKL